MAGMVETVMLSESILMMMLDGKRGKNSFKVFASRSFSIIEIVKL